MLPVSSRVTSTEPRSSTLRNCASSRACAHRSAGARAQVRRDLVQQRAEQPPDLRQVRLVTVVRAGVRGGELSDLGVPGGRVRGQPQVPAVHPRGEVRALRVDVIPVPLQPEVADEIGRQQRHHVRQRRDRVPGPERMLADRRAAGHVAALADQRAQPAAGQVRGGDQAVVPAADDDRVPVSPPLPVRLLPVHEPEPTGWAAPPAAPGQPRPRRAGAAAARALARGTGG